MDSGFRRNDENGLFWDFSNFIKKEKGLVEFAEQCKCRYISPVERPIPKGQEHGTVFYNTGI